MRTGALALVMLVAACGGSGPADEAAGGNAATVAAPPDSRETAATVTLSASGQGNCSAQWDGQPASAQQVTERGAALIEQAIQRAGGVSGLTDANTPVIAVAAPPTLGFACVDTYLSAIRRSSIPTVLLMPVGDASEAALARFTLTDIAVPPPTVVLRVGAGGRLSYNDETISLDAIPERLSRLNGGSAAIEVPAGELEIRPAREATFGQFHQVLRAVRASRVGAALLLPSMPPPVRAAPAPVPPGPPRELSEIGNQAAPANEAAPAR